MKPLLLWFTAFEAGVLLQKGEGVPGIILMGMSIALFIMVARQKNCE